ncbi:DNA polymerase [Bartonella sp. DGB2]|uniref:DNA polymerase n=1 Tax=Bartonella sp. DGB2 TaxID=3388426 RepID=UPI0039901315
MELIFDIETDGLLPKVSKIHCLVIKDLKTGQISSFTQETMEQGIALLSQAERLIGHNIIGFDLPVIQKLYPKFEAKGALIDTLVFARLIWPQISDIDHNLIKKGRLPSTLLGRYSLEAFGYRFGNYKGDYAQLMQAKGLDPWAAYSEDMRLYCEQDVALTHVLYKHLLEKSKGCEKAISLEIQVAKILARQTQWGFAFDKARAQQFYLELISEREALNEDLQKTFGMWIEPDGVPKVAKQTHRFKGQLIAEGVTYQKIKYLHFNPNSTHHIANRLQKLFGWKPKAFTPSGKPQLDETILAKLPWPQVKQLARYMMLSKRIGQLYEGNQAWLKLEQKGRIHGRVNTLGAVTRRMTHQNPNMAQVPNSASAFGKECRALFRATEGFVLVGCDADALELRCLAGYMARYDEGAYIQTVLSGDKAQGTDMHSVNARALGLDPKALYKVESREASGRDIAKTWFYAFIYGAGDLKLGLIMGANGSDKKIAQSGKSSRNAFLVALPALGQLVNAVKERVQKRGFLKAIDGGRLLVRSQHGALNTLLQSAGALFMKQALVILDQNLKQAGLIPRKDYEFCANIHDEWQIDVRPPHVAFVMKAAPDSIRLAGEAFNFACPLAGNAVSGETWAHTH